MSILSIVGLILLPACHLPLPPLPLLPMPPAISTIQVNEASDIISWQPPAEPNGQILHYNICIYRGRGWESGAGGHSERGAGNV